MWRSFLSQPLLSHLRRRPTGCISHAVISANRSILRRAYASSTPEVVEGGRPRRHLYVVLDQMNEGHSIYKLNVDDLDGGDEEAVTHGGMDDADEAVPPPPPPRRLPEAVLRLGVSAVGSDPQFQVLGSKIVIIGSPECCPRTTFVYDTKTAKLDTAKPLEDSFFLNGLSFSVGNKLHVLTPPGEPLRNLAEEPAEPRPYEDRRDQDYVISSLRGQLQRWAWNMNGPLDDGTVGVGNRPIQSYALHPCGHTIFFGSSESTFTLDTNNVGESARRIGDWRLPFHGRAYYDRDLGAWVGMRRDDVVEGVQWGRHHLCSCDIPSVVSDDAAVPPPTWKACSEDLTFLEAPLRDFRRKRALVHTERGRFCLVEAAPVQEPAEGKVPSHCTCTNNGVEHLLLVTMFRAKHGKNGELVVAPCRSGRSYMVPNYFDDSPFSSHLPVAFWM